MNSTKVSEIKEDKEILIEWDIEDMNERLETLNEKILKLVKFVFFYKGVHC